MCWHEETNKNITLFHSPHNNAFLTDQHTERFHVIDDIHMHRHCTQTIKNTAKEMTGRLMNRIVAHYNEKMMEVTRGFSRKPLVCNFSPGQPIHQHPCFPMNGPSGYPVRGFLFYGVEFAWKGEPGLTHMHTKAKSRCGGRFAHGSAF